MDFLDDFDLEDDYIDENEDFGSDNSNYTSTSYSSIDTSSVDDTSIKDSKKITT